MKSHSYLLLSFGLCYVLITRFMFSIIRFLFGLLLCMFYFLFCVLCVFVLFCVLLLLVYIVLYFLFVYTFTDHCHLAEPQIAVNKYYIISKYRALYVNISARFVVPREFKPSYMCFFRLKFYQAVSPSVRMHQRGLPDEFG
jgi:hypothetical protein